MGSDRDLNRSFMLLLCHSMQLSMPFYSDLSTMMYWWWQLLYCVIHCFNYWAVYFILPLNRYEDILVMMVCFIMYFVRIRFIYFFLHSASITAYSTIGMTFFVSLTHVSKWWQFMFVSLSLLIICDIRVSIVIWHNKVVSDFKKVPYHILILLNSKLE